MGKITPFWGPKVVYLSAGRLSAFSWSSYGRLFRSSSSPSLPFSYHGLIQQTEASVVKIFEGVSNDTQHLVGSDYLIFNVFLELQLFIYGYSNIILISNLSQLVECVGVGAEVFRRNV